MEKVMFSSTEASAVSFPIEQLIAYLILNDLFGIYACVARTGSVVVFGHENVFSVLREKEKVCVSCRLQYT